MAGISIPASPTSSGLGDGASGTPANVGASPSGMLSMVGTPIGNLGDLTAARRRDLPRRRRHLL